MANDFKINKRGVRQLTRSLEREFAKNPVRVPIEADSSRTPLAPATTVNNYHGPVVNVTGDHAQLAWDNDTANQSQARVEQIAAGYEDLARTLTALLASMASLGLSDVPDARDNAEAVLNEITKDEPDEGVIRRGVTMLRGILAPIAAGVSSAVTSESAEAARHFIEMLSSGRAC